MPNVKVNCVKYDKETKTHIHYTEGIEFNLMFYKIIKELYNELYISSTMYDFETWYRGQRNNKEILDGCYEVLKALFQKHYNNPKYVDFLYLKLLRIRKSWW